MAKKLPLTIVVNGQPASLILDPTRKVESYGFAPGTTLFLNLRAGIGGHR